MGRANRRGRQSGVRGTSKRPRQSIRGPQTPSAPRKAQEGPRRQQRSTILARTIAVQVSRTKAHPSIQAKNPKFRHAVTVGKFWMRRAKTRSPKPTRLYRRSGCHRGHCDGVTNLGVFTESFWEKSSSFLKSSPKGLIFVTPSQGILLDTRKKPPGLAVQWAGDQTIEAAYISPRYRWGPNTMVANR